MQHTSYTQKKHIKEFFNQPIFSDYIQLKGKLHSFLIEFSDEYLKNTQEKKITHFLEHNKNYFHQIAKALTLKISQKEFSQKIDLRSLKVLPHNKNHFYLQIRFLYQGKTFVSFFNNGKLCLLQNEII